MNEGYKILICDTETCGLDANLHDVVEISMCRLEFNNGTQTTDQKTWCLKALNPTTIQEEALKVNGHKREDVLGLTKFGKETYIHPSIVVPEIEMWVMEDNVSSVDRIFVGQNPFFDIAALQALWARVGSPDTFPFSLERNNRVIDTKQIAVMFDLCIGKRRKYYNLASLVKSFGVKKGKAHKASEDVRMTTDLLIKMLTPIKSVVQANFSECYDDNTSEE